jgi:hypothetical protein
MYDFIQEGERNYFEVPVETGPSCSVSRYVGDSGGELIVSEHSFMGQLHAYATRVYRGSARQIMI